MPSEPGTSILYRLYLESGALLNVNDLWSAFQTMVDGNEDVEEMQQRYFRFFHVSSFGLGADIEVSVIRALIIFTGPNFSKVFQK